MKRAKVKAGQTWADIAVEHYGSAAAAVWVAMANDAAVSDAPSVGRTIRVPDGRFDTQMQSWVKQNGVSPSTQMDPYAKERIFTEEFTEEFQ